MQIKPMIAQYIPKPNSLALLTSAIIILQAIRPETKADINPIPKVEALIPVVEADKFPETSSKKASPKTGIRTIKKENFAI